MKEYVVKVKVVHEYRLCVLANSRAEAKKEALVSYSDEDLTGWQEEVKEVEVV